MVVRVLIISVFIVSAFATSGWQHNVVKDRKYYEANGDIVWEVPTDKKVIALTFDDGPDRADTPFILDLLKQYDAKATFFVVGSRAKMFPDILFREGLEGHEIANHTYDHPQFNKNSSLYKVENQITKTDEAIYEITGQSTSLFRPPLGYYNDTIISATHHTQHTLIMWSWHQDTRDWDTPGVDKIVKRVLNNAHNGDIVLFHDYVQGKTQTIDALKLILPVLRERGYEFVTVSELLAMRQPKQPH